MKQIYKNLYYDEKEGGYWFINGDDRKQVVSQEAYLLIYLIEIMGAMK